MWDIRAKAGSPSPPLIRVKKIAVLMHVQYAGLRAAVLV
jgi:hypothetical protein